MQPLNIVIVGGVAAGASAATRARRLNESANITIFEKGADVSFANCGLPYHIGGQIPERKKLLIATPAYFKKRFNIDARVHHEVTAINRDDKTVAVTNLQTGQAFTQPYDKLILTPGAAPIVPPWDGTDAPNVFTLRDVTDMDQIKQAVDESTSGAESGDAKNAVVIGAGFIGLEMVEALTERGLNVSVVELQNQVLPPLDPDMAAEVEQTLLDNNVGLHLGTAVDNLIVTDSRVCAVKLEDDTRIPADLVILSIGVKPNTKLAENANLALGQTGAITVNRQQQTTDPDIYAAGDAVEIIHTVTGEAARIPLAGPANRQGRLAGQHAATDRAPQSANVPGTAVVGLFHTAAASTGLSQKAATRQNIPNDYAYAIRGHHVGYYPGAQSMILKLVYHPDSGKILGAQAVGGQGVDKRIDVIATAIQFGATIDHLAELDLTYAPQFGAAKDPVHIAAFIAINQRDGLVNALPDDRHTNPGQLVDVRESFEVAKGALPGAIHIPLGNLRENLDSLDREQPVTIYCYSGERSYNAARILMQQGFKQVYNLRGGYRMNKSL